MWRKGSVSASSRSRMTSRASGPALYAWPTSHRCPETDLIDRGTVIDEISNDYVGSAPDIGAYELGDLNYWIPGRQLDTATTPIPPDLGINVKTDADLMWLAGKNARPGSANAPVRAK